MKKTFKPTNYLEWIKRYDHFDKYILFLLAIGFSAKETADLVGMTPQHIHDVIRQDVQLTAEHQKLLEKSIMESLRLEQNDEQAKEQDKLQSLWELYIGDCADRGLQPTVKGFGEWLEAEGYELPEAPDFTKAPF